jgi:hypothetical protein
MRSPEEILAEMDAQGTAPMTAEYQEVLRLLVAVANAAKAYRDEKLRGNKNHRRWEALNAALAALEAP